MNESDQRRDDTWRPCPSGYLSRSVSKNVSAFESRRGFVYKAGGFGLVAILAALGIRIVVDKSVLKSDPMEFAVSCRQVKANMDDYILHAIDDSKLIIKIEKHLNELKCSTCCKLFDERKKALLA